MAVYVIYENEPMVFGWIVGVCESLKDAIAFAKNTIVDEIEWEGWDDDLFRGHTPDNNHDIVIEKWEIGGLRRLGPDQAERAMEY